MKLSAVDIEIAVAAYMNIRPYLVVPNISWGLFLHECDLLVLTPSGYAWEVEIKISKADLIRDKKKRHGHFNKKIKALYFAIPGYLLLHKEHIPERAGILLINENKKCSLFRRPKFKKPYYRFSQKERYKVARLGAMRIWGLKRKIIALNHKDKEL